MLKWKRSLTSFNKINPEEAYEQLATAAKAYEK